MTITLINTVLIFLTCSVIFQIVGLFTPGWMVMEDSHTRIETGLFYTKLCINGKCATRSNPVNNPPQEKLNAECQGLVISALILMGISIMLVFFVKRTQQKYVAMLLVGMTFISGLLVNIAIGKFSRELIHGANVLEQSTGSHPFKFPYSLLISGLGGALALLSSILIAIDIYRKHYRNSSTQTRITMPELRFHEGRVITRQHEDRSDHVIDNDDKCVLVQ